jgi:hypothetical protein
LLKQKIITESNSTTLLSSSTEYSSINSTSQTNLETRINSSVVSFKMGIDTKNKEVLIDVKNWKEIILVPFFLIFLIICIILIILFFNKYKTYFFRRKPLGFSYRSNH